MWEVIRGLSPVVRPRLFRLFPGCSPVVREPPVQIFVEQDSHVRRARGFPFPFP